MCKSMVVSFVVELPWTMKRENAECGGDMWSIFDFKGELIAECYDEKVAEYIVELANQDITK